MADLEEKCARLLDIFKEAKSAAVAFSGGVDSSFLLKAAHNALGRNAAAVCVSSVFMPQRELAAARRFCAEQEIHLIEIPFEPLSVKGVKENPPDRCYWCKKSLLSLVKKAAAENGLSTVMEGSNADDVHDFRPGLRAVAELGVRSPLKDCGFTKAEIRAASRTLGLSTWSKPSAACLASRSPYGEPLTERALGMAGKAEQFLAENGFPQMRVRIHGGTLARIEVPPEDFEKLMRIRTEVAAALAAAGFAYVSLDLIGFRSGSMNEALK